MVGDNIILKYLIINWWIFNPNFKKGGNQINDYLHVHENHCYESLAVSSEDGWHINLDDVVRMLLDYLVHKIEEA